MVDKLTEKEEEIDKEIGKKFSEEQMCACFLTITIRSQYQFDDDFIKNWYYATQLNLTHTNALMGLWCFE